MSVRRRYLPQSLKNSKLRRRLLARLAAEQGNLCALCLAPFSDDDPPTMDHVIPLGRKGNAGKSNIQAAHGRCNRERGDMLMSEWWWKRKHALS